MASLIFEGEFVDLDTRQINFIREILEKRGYENNKVIFAPVGGAGDNYVANVKRITVEVENDEDFTMIVKVAPRMDNVRTMMLADVLFQNESMLYTEVLPKFTRLQIDAGVPEEYMLNYAECYGCFTEEPYELILLEDLKPQNYNMLNKTEPLPDEAVKLILKNFAILHSMSYVLKDTAPDTYNFYKDKLVDMWTVGNERPENQRMAKQLELEIIGILENKEHVNVISGALTGSIVANREAVNRDKDSKNSVILQGDGWTNNIMFQIQDNIIKKSIMIDYQISRAGNPMSDILYMIFNCTNYKSRTEHFYNWLNYYHEELDKSLSYFGLNANIAYPKELLEADARRYTKIYFGTAILVLNFTLRGADEATDVMNVIADDFDNIHQSIAMSTLSEKTRMLYKSRIEELIDSCQQLNLLQK